MKFSFSLFVILVIATRVHGAKCENAYVKVDIPAALSIATSGDNFNIYSAISPVTGSITAKTGWTLTTSTSLTLSTQAPRVVYHAKKNDGTEVDATGTNILNITKVESIAIAGHGANGSTDDATEDARATNTGFTWHSANTGDRLIDQLETFCGTDKAIGALVIFSHGYWRGLILEDDKGFYVNTYGLTDAATIDDLAAKIASGDIRFYSPIIKVQACNTGSGTMENFAKRLSEATDGTVYGAAGLSSPEIAGGAETGWFWSSGSAWRKWVNGSEVENPHTTDEDLSTPNSYGSNKLRCW